MPKTLKLDFCSWEPQGFTCLNTPAGTAFSASLCKNASIYQIWVPGLRQLPTVWLTILTGLHSNKEPKFQRSTLKCKIWHFQLDHPRNIIIIHNDHQRESLFIEMTTPFLYFWENMILIFNVQKNCHYLVLRIWCVLRSSKFGVFFFFFLPWVKLSKPQPYSGWTFRAQAA